MEVRVWGGDRWEMKLRLEYEGLRVCLDFILEVMRNYLKFLKGRIIE